MLYRYICVPAIRETAAVRFARPYFKKLQLNENSAMLPISDLVPDPDDGDYTLSRTSPSPGAQELCSSWGGGQDPSRGF